MEQGAGSACWTPFAPQLIMTCFRHFITIFCLFAVLTTSARGRAAMTTGDDRAGYFLLPTPPLGFTLMMLPAEAPPGTIRRVINLGATPDLIAACDGTIVMLYRPSGSERAAPRAWLVRQVRLKEPVESVTSDPLPPLLTEGTPIDLTVASDRVLVLVRTDQSFELLELRKSVWQPLGLPNGFSTKDPAQLFRSSGRAALFQNQSELSAVLWQLDGDAAPPRWEAHVFPAVHDAELHGVADQNIAIGASEGGVESLQLVRPNGIASIATLADLKPDHWIVPGASTVTIVESDGNLLPRLSCRVISLSGATLYQGWALSSGTLAQRDFAFLALALASLFSAVLIFVFRPESARREAINLPGHTALAGPATRAMAGIIDAAIAWLLAGLSLGVLNSDLGAWLPPSGEQASMTLLAALFLGIVAATVLEYFTGRSPGKALTGCRVVTAAGTKISFMQAFARNVVRFLCPPLGMAWMLQAPDHAHGLFGTIVVIDLPEPPNDH